MLACTFFGHRECYGLDLQVLMDAIKDLICKDVDTFYVGDQGRFDTMVYSCLKQLRKTHLRIQISVVLAISRQRKANTTIQRTPCSLKTKAIQSLP